MNMQVAIGVTTAMLAAPGRNASRFRIIPIGRFRTSDGRPGNDTFELSPRRAVEMVAAAASRAQDYMIDYEHQMLKPGAVSPAAGWFKSLEANKDGLYVTDARWTSAALKMIQANEYRYVSPAFNLDADTGEVLSLINVALTNNPAVHGLTDLSVALRGQVGQPVLADSQMSEEDRAKYTAWFGFSPDHARRQEAAALRGETPTRSSVAAGFSGTTMTESQQEYWMRVFGKSPQELRRLVP